MNKKEKGITLIALVITIIVLLILAGITILMITGQDGILNKATRAKKQMEVGRQKEEMVIDQLQLMLGSQGEAWDKDTASAFAGGEGTEISPYLIENAQQLAYLAKQVNEGEDFEGVYIKIIKDIDLGYRKWTPIGVGFRGERTKTEVTSTETEFKGNLDGDGHIIRNLNIEETDMHGVGLIGTLGENGTVKNIVVANGRIIGRSCVAGIIGISNGIVKDCTSKVEVIARGDSTDYSGQMAGGVVGWITKGEIQNCTNNGTVLGENNVQKENRANYIGGIVGAINGDEIVVKNSVNNGEIIGMGQQVGGIVGGTENNSGNFTIQDCTNTGKVIARFSNGNNISGAYSGGIIGTVIGTGASIIRCNNQGEIISELQTAGGIVGYLTIGNIEQCINYGNVTAKYKEGYSSDSGLFSGGIVAMMDGTGTTITKCENRGEIIAELQRAGGIVGYAKATTGSVSECDNYGKVTVKYKEGDSDSGKYSAGIIGMISVSINTTNCTNEGEIIAENQFAGGIIGITAKGNVDSCVNTGKVMAKYVEGENVLGTYAGGIVGRSSGTEVNITNSSNTGYIIAEKSGAGGIVGILAKGTIRWCQNSQNITVNSNGSRGIAGGIAGMNSSGTIEKCYNTGKITNKKYLNTTVAPSGGILGALSSTGKVQYCYSNCEFEGGDVAGAIVGQFNNSSTASVTKCYYTGENINGIGSKGTDNAVITECINENNVTEKADAISSYDEFKTWIETK